MTIHDYRRRYWGHDYAILEVNNGGLDIKLIGWGFGISEGDSLLIAHEHGEAHYEIESIEYKDDPPDTWFATATYAPRA